MPQNLAQSAVGTRDDAQLSQRRLVWANLVFAAGGLLPEASAVPWCCPAAALVCRNCLTRIFRSLCIKPVPFIGPST